jgi:hypothetical protein
MDFDQAFAPFAQAYAARGEPGSPGDRRVVCIGADVPVELIEACGWRPVRLAGKPGLPAPDGDRFIAGGADGDVRSLFQGLIDGGYGPFERLVIAHDFEGLARLYYALRAFRRRWPERCVALPEPEFFDLLHMPWRSTAHYNRVRFDQLRSALGGCSDADLRAAVARRNAVRRRLYGLRAHRLAGRLSGSEALVVAGAVATLDPSTAAAWLDDLLGALPDRAPVRGTPVFVTGSAHDHGGYYARIEAAGLRIVSEDHDWGDRGHEALIDEGAADIADAIVERYQSGTPASAKFSIVERAAYTARAARRSGAGLVLATVRKEDPAPRWDITDQRAALGDVPLILLDDLPHADTDDFDEMLVAALEGLRHDA